MPRSSPDSTSGRSPDSLDRQVHLTPRTGSRDPRRYRFDVVVAAFVEGLVGAVGRVVGRCRVAEVMGADAFDPGPLGQVGEDSADCVVGHTRTATLDVVECLSSAPSDLPSREMLVLPSYGAGSAAGLPSVA
jgi:hypothetical protein